MITLRIKKNGKVATQFVAETILGATAKYRAAYPDREDRDGHEIEMVCEGGKTLVFESPASEQNEPDPCDGGDADGDASSALASAGFGTDEDYPFGAQNFSDSRE